MKRWLWTGFWALSSVAYISNGVGVAMGRPISMAAMLTALATAALTCGFLAYGYWSRKL